MEADKLNACTANVVRTVFEVDRICREEDIPYFIIAGTALGAVRHGGFIPWDDDFDIGMKRQDYERFLQIAPEKLDSAYFLQNHDTDPAAPFYFTKLRKNGTRFVEAYLKKLPMHHGVGSTFFRLTRFPLTRNPGNSIFPVALFGIRCMCRALYPGPVLGKSDCPVCSNGRCGRACMSCCAPFLKDGFTTGWTGGYRLFVGKILGIFPMR